MVLYAVGLAVHVIVTAQAAVKGGCAGEDFLLDCFIMSSFPAVKQGFILCILYLCRPPELRMSMEQLSWLQIGQHQLQQDVTHGLAFVLVDGRDDELDFSDLIGVFLLDGYGIFHVGLLPE